MNRVTIAIDAQGDARASEILADLRMAAEALYHPMRVVGFWEGPDMHLCPDEERRAPCAHQLNDARAAQASYAASMQRDRQANLQLDFPHAGLTLYLS